MKKVRSHFSCPRSASVLLIFMLLLALSASAAISEGPLPTNSYQLQRVRKTLADQAAQSVQDKARVAQERYARQQQDRDRTLQGMTSEMQSRQAVVAAETAGPTVAPADTVAVEAASWLRPVLALALLALIIASIGYVFNQRKRGPNGEDLSKFN